MTALSLFLILILGAADASAEPPPGWMLRGTSPELYEANTEHDAARDGTVATLRSTGKVKKREFGTLMQMSDPTPYLGKRVEMTAMVRSEGIQNMGGLWLRVDGDSGTLLAFDNMHERPIVGDTGWNEYSVVLDVHPNAKALAFGALLSGEGQLWFDDVHFEEVDPAKVPLTVDDPELPTAPVNGSFEEPS